MNWDYSIVDAVQLMIPAACSLLLLAVIIAYIFLYARFREKLYQAGLIISVCAALYVLFEFLVIVTGWTGNVQTGRIFHRLGQLTGAFFLYGVMNFTSCVVPEGSRLERLSRGMARFGLAAAVVISVLAFVLPDSFISVTNGIVRPAISPGDLGRGRVGILYSLRDAMLGVYLSCMIIFSTISLLKNHRDPKYFIIVTGTILAAVSAIDDILFYQFGHNLFLNAFRYSRLSVGLSLMILFIMTAIVNEFFRTHEELNKTHRKLSDTYGELQDTYRKLKTSERKYRHLSEGADQAIFSLSPGMRFMSMNQKARSYFALSRESENKHFIDVINHSHGGDSRVSRQIMNENLRQLSNDKESVTFHTIVDDPRTGEPEEYEFHFDYLETDEQEVEYIGRATKMKTSRLMRSIEYEKLKLTIENYIIAIDDVATRLTQTLNKYIDQGTVLMVKMGLQEIIINAIEHGNLNITFDEKTRAMSEGRYLDFIRERQQDPRYRDRRVCIDYVLTEESVQYMVTDQGCGFDFESTMNKVDKTVEKDMLTHGRGINMTRVLFDQVKYNKKGNQVLLVKNLKTA